MEETPPPPPPLERIFVEAQLELFTVSSQRDCGDEIKPLSVVKRENLKAFSEHVGWSRSYRGKNPVDISIYV